MVIFSAQEKRFERFGEVRMIVKRFLDEDFEILMTQNYNKTYNIIKKIKNVDCGFYSNLDFESASDVFDDLLEELGDFE